MSSIAGPAGPMPVHGQAVGDDFGSNVLCLPPTAQLASLLTTIRDRDTPRAQFIFTSDRVIRLLVEEGLNHLPVVPKQVTTPTGDTYDGVAFEGKICGVSIVRAGEAMEAGLRDVCRSVRILVQRDETTALPKLFYHRLPEDIAYRHVLLLDPMLATGGSALKAIEVLIEHKVAEERITFISLVAAPEGIRAVHERYPHIKLVTAWIDKGLNGQHFIVPGLGDFGDRYFSS